VDGARLETPRPLPVVLLAELEPPEVGAAEGWPSEVVETRSA
jgi:hypothetical protein